MNMSTGNVLLPPNRIKYIYLNVDESAWSAPRPSGATIHAEAKRRASSRRRIRWAILRQAERVRAAC